MKHQLKLILNCGGQAMEAKVAELKAMKHQLKHGFLLVPEEALPVAELKAMKHQLKHFKKFL